MGKRLIITEEEKTNILLQHFKKNNNTINEIYGLIPNPKKEIIVDLPIAFVTEIVDNLIPIINGIENGYESYDKSIMTKTWTIQKTEFLSLGVYIDIHLTEIDNNKTKINIEVRRKLGGYDSPLEVQVANDHIKNILKSIEKGTNSEVLDTAKNTKPTPNSIEGMGLTKDEWHNLGRPNVMLIYDNGFKSYKEWVDSGKPQIKGYEELEAERKRKKKEQLKAEREAKGIKPSFWERLFED
jgi:hypothetical protein